MKKRLLQGFSGFGPRNSVRDVARNSSEAFIKGISNLDIAPNAADGSQLLQDALTAELRKNARIKRKEKRKAGEDFYEWITPFGKPCDPTISRMFCSKNEPEQEYVSLKKMRAEQEAKLKEYQTAIDDMENTLDSLGILTSENSVMEGLELPKKVQKRLQKEARKEEKRHHKMPEVALKEEFEELNSKLHEWIETPVSDSIDVITDGIDISHTNNDDIIMSGNTLFDPDFNPWIDITTTIVPLLNPLSIEEIMLMRWETEEKVIKESNQNIDDSMDTSRMEGDFVLNSTATNTNTDYNTNDLDEYVPHNDTHEINNIDSIIEGILTVPDKDEEVETDSNSHISSLPGSNIALQPHKYHEMVSPLVISQETIYPPGHPDSLIKYDKNINNSENIKNNDSMGEWWLSRPLEELGGGENHEFLQKKEQNHDNEERDKCKGLNVWTDDKLQYYCCINYDIGCRMNKLGPEGLPVSRSKQFE